MSLSVDRVFFDVMLIKSIKSGCICTRGMRHVISRWGIPKCAAALQTTQQSQLHDDGECLLRILFAETFDNGMLPQTLTQLLSVLLKDKDPLECGSYRPIALLSCDYKTLTKALARHLETILPLIIHPEHQGLLQAVLF